MPSCCPALHKTMWHGFSLNLNKRIIELFNKGPEVYFLLGQKRTKETWSIPGFIFIFILLPPLYHQKLCCLLLANPSIKLFISQKYCTSESIDMLGSVNMYSCLKYLHSSDCINKWHPSRVCPHRQQPSPTRHQTRSVRDQQEAVTPLLQWGDLQQRQGAVRGGVKEGRPQREALLPAESPTGTIKKAEATQDIVV